MIIEVSPNHNITEKILQNMVTANYRALNSEELQRLSTLSGLTPATILNARRFGPAERARMAASDVKEEISDLLMRGSTAFLVVEGHGRVETPRGSYHTFGMKAQTTPAHSLIAATEQGRFLGEVSLRGASLDLKFDEERTRLVIESPYASGIITAERGSTIYVFRELPMPRYQRNLVREGARECA